MHDMQEQYQNVEVLWYFCYELSTRMLAAVTSNYPSVIGGNSAFMRTMVEKGLLGRKAGKGFYLYPKEAKKSSKEKQINPEVR
jgi:3-hydroxyacyl-CoA dehydrogenase